MPDREPGRGKQPKEAGPSRRPLTSDDIRRLTLYKWRYTLESSGFTQQQVRDLMFLKWLYARNRVTH